MPFAPRIRKDILKALDEHIIPALWKQQVPLGYVAPPLRFPAGIEKHLINRRLPLQNKKASGFPIRSTWSKANLHSTSHAYLSFIYEGLAEERTLISATQASRFEIEKGIHVIHFQTPGVLFFPPDTPRNTGAADIFSTKEGPFPPVAKILQLAFRDEILAHLYTRTMAEVEVTHSLLVNDAHLLNLALLFEEEIRNMPISNQEAAQATLLALLLRLRYCLFSRPPRLANTSHPPIPDLGLINGRGQEIYREAIQFIQTHLHEGFSLPFLAQKLHTSPTHLNRLFHRFSGVTVMRYVRRQRIEAAKTMLILNQENVKEIAALLHFKSSSAFCAVFHQETGLTPKQFRHQAKD